MVRPIPWLTQAATEYGAVTGNAAAQVGPGSPSFADQALDFVSANPIALAIGIFTVLIVASFARTGRYRS